MSMAWFHATPTTILVTLISRIQTSWRQTKQMEDIDAASAALISTPYFDDPNFVTENVVLLDQPLSKVFPILADGKKMEKVVRLSRLCTHFTLLHSDWVERPTLPFTESQTRLRTAPSVSKGLPRQFFSLSETIPLLPGWLDIDIEIAGSQTWDEESKSVLYEVVTNRGIVIRKLRTMEDVSSEDGPRTKVYERIEGRCMPLMNYLVQYLGGYSNQ